MEVAPHRHDDLRPAFRDVYRRAEDRIDRRTEVHALESAVMIVVGDHGPFCSEKLFRVGGHRDGAMASTRSGLPLPPTILRGAAITIAPVGGSRSRFLKLARPNFPAPCIVAWLGKGGSNVP